MNHSELIDNWNRMDKATADAGLTAAAMSAMSEEIDRLRHCAESADQQLMAYRVLMTGAMLEAAQASGLPPVLEPFASDYFTTLFQVALDSGAFVEAGCGTTGILAVAEQLHVRSAFPGGEQ